jgi:hypothetical protein
MEERGPSAQTKFGRSFGCPVIKDKTFFFASYSELRQRPPAFKNSAAPADLAERNGDLRWTYSRCAVLIDTLRE